MIELKHYMGMFVINSAFNYMRFINFNHSLKFSIQSSSCNRMYSYRHINNTSIKLTYIKNAN